MSKTVMDSVPFPGQESWKFIDELQQPEIYRFRCSGRCAKPDEADLGKGVCIRCRFPETEGRLQTAYDDLRTFLRAASIPEGENFSIITEQGESGPFDSFRLVISLDSCRIIANDQEGIRRGIFYMEELLLGNDGPFLPTGEIRKNAWLKNRISRCFFGPLKRPPMNRDELMDDVDYYPDAYLNRLAHEGINALWLTVELHDLSRTEFTPDEAPDREKRLAKLKQTAEKCLRYGIRTFLFMIEPLLWRGNEDVLKRFPELAGARLTGGGFCFCPSSETAYRYLYQSVYAVFSAVPELGGIINISLGERPSTCLSSLPLSGHVPEQDPVCPRCGKLPKAEILYNSVKAMTDGMLKASPKAEFISWYYLAAPQEQEPWTFTLTKLPEHASILYNFESGGQKEQLGKERVSGDYWLTYTGPSGNFLRMAEEAKKAGVPIGAKIQAACSHELATIPEVPVPGQLYRKYRAMKELGVTTVMQCWYFGNYPGIMNRAAGMLAFEEFNTDESDFLHRLALPDWKKCSQEMAEIWKQTSEACQHYPFSNTMQYYGPYHSGVVWPLYPYPQHRPLAPTWRTDYPEGGDTIGELLDNHTLAEAEELAGMLARKWHHAREKALHLQMEFADEPERLRDLSLLEALDLQFTSAWHILRFYLLRSEENGFTDEMRSIMQDEIAVSERMVVLCSADPRLGFHSEAENYEYFPAKLKARIAFLKEMLVNPAPEVTLPEAMLNTACEAKTYTWTAVQEKEQLKLCIRLRGRAEDDQLFVTLSGGTECRPLCFELNRTGLHQQNCPAFRHTSAETAEDWRVELSLPVPELHSRNGILHLSLIRLMRGDCPVLIDCSPIAENAGRKRIQLGFYHPGQMYQINLRSQ